MRTTSAAGPSRASGRGTRAGQGTEGWVAQNVFYGFDSPAKGGVRLDAQLRGRLAWRALVKPLEPGPSNARAAAFDLLAEAEGGS